MFVAHNVAPPFTQPKIDAEADEIGKGLEEKVRFAGVTKMQTPQSQTWLIERGERVSYLIEFCHFCSWPLNISDNCSNGVLKLSWRACCLRCATSPFSGCDNAAAAAFA